MNFSLLKKRSRFYKPVFVLEQQLSHSKRKQYERFFFFLTVTFAFLSLGIVMPVYEQIVGAFLVSGSMWVIAVLLDFYYHSYYLASASDLFEKSRYHPIDMSVAKVLISSDSRAVAQDFIHSDLGDLFFRAFGIEGKERLNFFAKRKSPLTARDIIFNEDSLELDGFVKALLRADDEMTQLFADRGFGYNDVIEVAREITRKQLGDKKSIRKWGRENLSRIPTLGKTWSYGSTPLSDVYSDASCEVGDNECISGNNFLDKKLASLEGLLAQDVSRNILVVAESNSEISYLIQGLRNNIVKGIIPTQLEHKRLMVLDTDKLNSMCDTKDDLKDTLVSIVQELSSVGNVFLCIQDLSLLVTLGKSMNLDVLDVINKHITGPRIQVVAFTTRDNYNQMLSGQNLIEGAHTLS